MIRLSFPIPPSETLRRIDAFGREWRESKMPPDLRLRGFTGARTTVDGASFTLSLQPAQRNATFIVRGAVTSEGDQSLVTAEVHEAKWSKRLALGWILVFGTVFVLIALRSPGGDSGDVAFAITLMAVVLFIRLLILEGLR